MQPSDKPGREVTKKLFRHWQKARRGTESPHDLTNPVWQWLFRGRVDPYQANERFKGRLARWFGRIDFPTEPRWAGCRMGQSYTRLSDGREFWIAGEHEDSYDPDFFIYNDVIIQHPDDRLQILGYPASVFRPTDFHSATAIENESAILLIGSIGYSDDRREDSTQVYRLDTRTMDLSEVETLGTQPGWIHKHKASLADHGSRIDVTGGKVLAGDGFIENIDDWSLSLSDWSWTRLTKRKWTRVQIGRTDGESLHLWQYSMLGLLMDSRRGDKKQFAELAAELGAEPDMEVYGKLYKPSIAHQSIERDFNELNDEDDDEDEDDDDDDDWWTNKLVIESVPVRIVDDMTELTLTIEGELSRATIETLADELRQKLAILENADCSIRWI